MSTKLSLHPYYLTLSTSVLVWLVRTRPGTCLGGNSLGNSMRLGKRLGVNYANVGTNIVFLGYVGGTTRQLYNDSDHRNTTFLCQVCWNNVEKSKRADNLSRL